MQNTSDYSIGDWIVHTHYGIGQIRDVEAKAVSGEEAKYYRIIAPNSIYWIPVDQTDSDLIRQVSSDKEMEEAIAALQREPKEMSSNHLTRKSRIRRTRLGNTPLAIARLVRDLRAHQLRKGKLNLKEKSAFDKLKKRLAEEWAVATGTRTEKVARRLENLLLQQEPLAE